MLRKSRSGCRECRVRKVKCDEIRPVCSNCRRRYLDAQSCDWNEKARLIKSRNSTDVNERPVHHLNPYTILATDTNRRRTLELRLMYHYTTAVSYELPECSGMGLRTWQQVIPRLSFESELVLNPMLALSALHLHAYSPEDPVVAIAVSWYLDRAHKDYRQALSVANVVSEELWLAAVLLAHLHWLLAHQQHPNTMYELPLQAYNMLQGLSTLFANDQGLLKQSGYNWIGNKTIPPIPLDDELLLTAGERLEGVELELTQLLDVFDVSSMPEHDKSIYMHVKDYTLYCYLAFYSGASAESLRPFIGFMPLNCHLEYRAMLERHDPLSMAMLARGLVLLNGLDHSWWINGKGDYVIVERDIRGIRSLMPARLRWAMDWPCGVVDGTISL